MTEPSHVAFVGAPIEAVGTETAAPNTAPKLPTSAVDLAVLFASDSIVDVPVTPVIEAPWAPLAVTCALLVMPAYETDPARAPPRLMLPARVWASASFVAFALTSTDPPPVICPFMFASTFPLISAVETKNVPAARRPAVPP